jgi:competence protein ComEC
MRKPSLFILDVGHGSSAVLVDRKGVVVIDAGPRTALLEFLKREDITDLSAVLISHADTDHIEGLISLIESEELTVKRVRLNSDSEKGSKLWRDLLYLLDKGHAAKKLDFDVALTTRNSGDFDQGRVHIEILAPSLILAGIGPGGTDANGRMIRSNSLSAVFRLTLADRPVALIPGDLDDVGLCNLLEDGKDPSAPFAVFPHHGGKPGDVDVARFVRNFCSAVRPQTVVFSIGRGKYGMPRRDVVLGVQKALPGVRVVCTQLSEDCAATLPAAQPSHLTDSFAQGKRQLQCCAGTIQVRLHGAALTILPSQAEHLAFIRQSAPKALCQTEETTRRAARATAKKDRRKS